MTILLLFLQTTEFLPITISQNKNPPSILLKPLPTHHPKPTQTPVPAFTQPTFSPPKSRPTPFTPKTPFF